MTSMSVQFTLPIASTTIPNGTYFHVNEEVEVVAGLPIMPRTSVTVTLPNEIAHGAFFESGHYVSYNNFDPVIARLITDTVEGMVEPDYSFGEWVPAAWDVVNSLQTDDSLVQRLVVLPAQYSANDEETGMMRVFDSLQYTVYYSDSEDIWPPTFWQVEEAIVGSNRTINVEVTDLSGISRVSVSYTTGNGWWYTTNLSPTLVDPDVWTGGIPNMPGSSYFIQALDKAANVSTETNKNWYYGQDSSYTIYLPLILK